MPRSDVILERNMKIIDMAQWPRKEAFELFSTYESPHFNVCVSLDITNTFGFLEEHRISKFNAMLWMISCAANSVAEIRCRIRENRVVEHDAVHPSFTFLNPDQSLSFCYADYSDDIAAFFQRVAQGIERVRAEPSLKDEPGKDDMIFVSCVPWINFTSISHPMKLGNQDSFPRISWGKFTPQGQGRDQRMTMPVSLQLHHGLADGYHAGLFFEKLESLLENPEALSWPV